MGGNYFAAVDRQSPFNGDELFRELDGLGIREQEREHCLGLVGIGSYFGTAMVGSPMLSSLSHHGT